jgi:hypothetical protein
LYLSGSECSLLLRGGLVFVSVRVGEVVDMGGEGESSVLRGLSGFISMADSLELVGECESLESDEVNSWRPIVTLGMGREVGLCFLSLCSEVVREKRTRAARRSGSITRSTWQAPEFCR